MQGLQYVLSKAIKNGQITGIPLWLDAETYIIGSVVNSNSILYVSITDDNIGNDPTIDTTNWKFLAKTFTNVLADIDLSNITVSGETVIKNLVDENFLEKQGTNATSDTLDNIANAKSEQVDYVIEQYKNGNNWYRKWRSGWIEQGGGFPTTVSQATITLLVPFSDNNYFVSFQTGLNGSGVETVEINLCYFQASFKRNTDFNCQRRMNSGAISFNAVDRWYACGY